MRRRYNRQRAAAPNAAEQPFCVFVQLDENAQFLFNNTFGVSFSAIVAVTAMMVGEGSLSGEPDPERGKLIVRLSADNLRAVVARIRATQPVGVLMASLRKAINTTRAFIKKAREKNSGLRLPEAEALLTEAIDGLRTILGATGSPEKVVAATTAAKAALEAAEAAIMVAKQEVREHLLARAEALAKRVGASAPTLEGVDLDEDRRVLVEFIEGCETVEGGARDGRLPAAPAYPHWGRGGGRSGGRR